MAKKKTESVGETTENGENVVEGAFGDGHNQALKSGTQDAESDFDNIEKEEEVIVKYKKACDLKCASHVAAISKLKKKIKDKHSFTTKAVNAEIAKRKAIRKEAAKIAEMDDTSRDQYEMFQVVYHSKPEADAA